MKISFHIFLILLFSSSIILTNTASAQISGYVKNSANQGLAGKIVEVYLRGNTTGNHYTWYHSTNQQGRFTADPNTTDIDDKIYPEDYKIDAPYPNPFNPSSIISLAVFKLGNYKLILFNPIGEQVQSYKAELKVGIHKFSIKEPGAAGIYLYSLIGEDGSIFSGKLCYLGGGKQETEKITYLHSEDLPIQLKKTTNSAFTLDSIKVRGDAIQAKTFPFNIQTDGILDVGDLLVDSAFININGKIYKLFDWQEPTNGIEGATIKIGNKPAVTDINGNYQLEAPTGLQWIEITHPNTWTRKTQIIAYNSATLPDINVMDKTRMPQEYLAFFDSVSCRIGNFRPEPYKMLARWMETINPYYIVTDTNFARDSVARDSSISAIEHTWKPLTITPLYPQGFFKDITIETGMNPTPDFTDYKPTSRMEEDLGGPFALTYPKINFSDTSQTFKFGEVNASLTTYWRNMPLGAWWNIKGIILHEQARTFMGLTSNILGNKLSIFDAGLIPSEPTEYDKRWILYTFSRLPGNKTPDTDYYIIDAATGKWLNPKNGQIVEP